MAKKESFLARTFKVLNIRKTAAGTPQLNGQDIAVLQVALMVAALDGRIESDEFKTFDRLVRKCPGVTAESAAAALETALRAGGYLLAQSFRLSGKSFVSVFIEEVGKIINFKLAAENPQAMRRAFCMWMSMAMADDEFSAIERDCLMALHVALRAAVEKWAADQMQLARQRSPVYVSNREIREGTAQKLEAVWPANFPEKIERALTQLAHADDPDNARAVRSLINGEF